MKINWSVRLRNKTWLAAMLVAVIDFGYKVLSLLEIVPPISEDSLLEIVSTSLALLTMVGVVIDPTTKGVSDSERALEYESPQ